MAVGPSPTEPLTLHDGSICDLATLDDRQLLELHWREERILARRIVEAPKGSPERDAAVGHAYDTITRILHARNRHSDQPLMMGLDRRYVRLVLDLLRRQQTRGVAPSFFEVGFGTGVMLKEVAEQGFDTAGVEVSAELHREARELLGPNRREWLLVGDVRKIAVNQRQRHTLIYWNDVFEHIPPDEIDEYLAAIRSMLVPGGLLVTLTPNWHFRPSDITRDFEPRRSEAVGLHLKEYTLREVTAMLRLAGFQGISTPLFETKKRMYVVGSGLTTTKHFFEPFLERLPFRLAEILCRGFCLNCTIAQNPR